MRRKHGAQMVYSVEVFSDNRHMDSCVTIDRAADYRGPADEQAVQGPDRAIRADSVYRSVALAGSTASLMIGGAYIGEVSIDASGDFGAPDLPGEMQLGFNFEPTAELWPPQDNDDQRAIRRKQRIVEVLTRWRGRYLAINGKLRTPYIGGENTEAAPPMRDELCRVPMFGWSDEPSVTVSRPYPGPWTLLGVVQRVKN